MTESVRRRKSKWDLKEDPHPFPSETREDNTWSGKRNVREDESYKRDCNEISHTTRTMRDDRSYSRSMSPGLDEWRQQHRSRSPKSGWSRSHRSRSRSRSWSRSRSPPHGFRHELENDRRGSGSRVSAPGSDDYAAGKCKRGHDCRFPHQDNHDYNGRRHSGSSPREDWASRHERGGSSGNAINEEIMDYSRDKISHNEYAGDLEKNETLRSTRAFGICDSYLRGSCFRGLSCRYDHHGASSDGHGMRERAHDRRDTNASFGHDNRREPRRITVTPCKFFASGNCRNGKSCRFSHEVATRGSPEWRSRDDRQDHDLNHENRSRGGPEARLVDNWGHSLNEENRSWGGSKWSDKPVDSGIIKSPWRIDNDGGKMGVLGSRSVDGQKLDTESRTWGVPIWNDKPADRDPRRSPQSLNDNSGASISLQDSTGNLKLRNSVNMPLFIGEHMGHSQDLHGQNLNEVSLQTLNQNIAKEFSGHSATLQPTFSEDVYNNAVPNTATPQNEVNFSADMVPVPGQSDLKGPKLDPRSLTSFSMNGRNQPILPTPDYSAQDFNLKERVPQYISQPSSNSQQQTMTHQGEPFTNPDIVDLKVLQVTPGTSMAQNLVTSEQVAKLTNLSASLAQIFGNGQQLPQLYAALNPQNPSGLVHTTHLNSAGQGVQVVTPRTQPTQVVTPLTPPTQVVTPLTQPTQVVTPLNQPNQTTQSQKQYDPISDSIESSKPDSGIQNLPGFSTKPNDQNKIADGELQPPLKAIAPSSVTDEPNGGDSSKISSLEGKPHEDHQLKQPEQNANQSEADQNKEQNTAHSGDMEVDGQVDEDGKKSKEAKGMRMFRFALVDFVKELLKPTWKEGQLSKEAHKTIVKKVVEKVTGSIQGAQIPQTQEKIDHYLSYSKPKLSKLVQAYVEKYLKT